MSGKQSDRSHQSSKNSCHTTLCDGLEPDIREELAAISRLRTFPKGATILAQGEPLDIVGNVISGVLRMEKLLSDGRQQIVGLLVPTDMFGRVFNETSEFSIEAATDVTLCCFNRLPFEDLVLRSPQLEHAVLLAVLDELDASREWIMLLAGQTVASRLANYLLMLCRRWPHLSSKLTDDRSQIVLSIPIGRSDLAHYLGTTVESISRNVQGLARKGLIRVLSPNKLVIVDLPGLIEASGNDAFDSEALMAAIGNASRRDRSTSGA